MERTKWLLLVKHRPLIVNGTSSPAFTLAGLMDVIAGHEVRPLSRQSPDGHSPLVVHLLVSVHQPQNSEPCIQSPHVVYFPQSMQGTY